MSRVLSLRAYEFRLKAIELRTDFEPGLPPVLGDGGQLQQALLNLLLNAEQAMRNGPERRIHVGARYVADAGAVEHRRFRARHPGRTLAGSSIPSSRPREVGEGTGLGLSICYGIVRDHGGQITVESRVGQGTTFKVLLPACARIPEDPLKALVAHRDATERDYVAAALTGWGHTVIAAESASEARARLEAGGIDVALVDDALIGAESGVAARAARAGKSLQEYLRGMLVESAMHATVDDVIARARARVTATGVRVDTSRSWRHKMPTGVEHPPRMRRLGRCRLVARCRPGRAMGC